MPRFVHTPRGYVNLNGVTDARSKGNGRFELYAGDKLVDADHPDFPELVISALPVSGEWECLSTCSEDNGSESVLSEPVLAWGLTVTGDLIPIVPSETSGVTSDFALRRMGTSRVYEPGGDIYDDEAAWLQIRKKTALIATNSCSKGLPNVTEYP
jgi:hypothetical protein